MAEQSNQLPAMARLMRETRFAKGEEEALLIDDTQEKSAPASKPERFASA